MKNLQKGSAVFLLFLLFLANTHVLFLDHLCPCFAFLVTSPLGFKARVGSALFAFFAEANVMYIPCDSTLVLHLLTFWQLLSCFFELYLFMVYPGWIPKHLWIWSVCESGIDGLISEVFIYPVNSHHLRDIHCDFHWFWSNITDHKVIVPVHEKISNRSLLMCGVQIELQLGQFIFFKR